MIWSLVRFCSSRIATKASRNFRSNVREKSPMRCLANCCSIVLPPARFFGEVFPEGPQNAPVVDRAMLVKPAIFRGHHRLTHGLGNLVGGEEDAVFMDKNAAQLLAVDVVKRRGDVEIVQLL